MVEKIEKGNYTLIVLPDGVVYSPSGLSEFLREMPGVDASKGVVISGRAPVWVYAALAHHYHPTLWVGTHDPRLGGAVVVQTHSTVPTVGTVMKEE